MSDAPDHRLLHNYHELDDIGRLLYQVRVKPTWDTRQQFFFEGCRDLVGQMYIADRQALYDIILKYRPKQCFEIGTWTGGGGTYFLSSAFRTLGEGKVITLESHPVLHEVGSAFYRRYLPDLNPFVEFLHGHDVTMFNTYIDPAYGVDCVFIDGMESAEETYAQYEFFLPRLRDGAVLMIHDWNTDKQRLLRPILEASPDWVQEMYIGEPYSVGFAQFIYHPQK